MTEPIRLVPAEGGPVRPQQLLAHQRPADVRARPRAAARQPARSRRWRGRPSPPPRHTRSPSALGPSRRSSRAASSAWMVGGTLMVRRSRTATQLPLWRTSDPSSISIPNNSSTKNGFPSAASAIRCRTPGSRSARPSRPMTSSPDSRRVERLELDRRRRQLAAAPRRTRLEQLLAAHAQQQDRRVPRRVGDVLDQVEQARLRPVDVVEEQHQRPLPRQPLEEPANRPERVLRVRRPSAKPTASATRSRCAPRRPLRRWPAGRAIRSRARACPSSSRCRPPRAPSPGSARRRALPVPEAPPAQGGARRGPRPLRNRSPAATFRRPPSPGS